MNARSRVPHSGRRLSVGLLLAIALFFNTVGTLFAAGTTGTINGTISDLKTGAPIVGAKVSAVSPTGRYSVSTDARGFFSFTGISPDTYTVSVEYNGYQPTSSTGINVFADQVINASTRLDKSLVTIGRVTARSPGGAYQPTQTSDTYTVTSAQIATQLGKANAVSETNLLVSLPGASLDSSGYPVLRGGRENEEGFQYEGIDYVDAFTNQFVNSLSLNPGIGQLQLIPGAGDASSGNTGTGIINLISKKGTYPGFGSLELSANAQPFDHQLSFEYGFATPDGRLSNYIGFTGERSDFQYGARGTPAETLSTGTFYNTRYSASADITDNLIYKFGKNNNQQVQLFFQNQRNDFYGGYGGLDTTHYATSDPFVLDFTSNDTGLTIPQIQKLVERYPGQPNTASGILDRGGQNYYQPNDTLKLQYSNNIDSSTFFTLKAYKTNAVTTFDFPYNQPTEFPFQETYQKQGGQRTGTALDLTKQINSKNLIQLGGKFDFLHPIFDAVDPLDGLFAISGFNAGFEVADFISPTDPDCPAGAGNCGYLYKFFPNGPGTVPRNNETAVTNRQDYAAYILDQFSPNERLKINAGVRLDGTNYQLPGLEGCNPTTFAQFQTGDRCQYAPTSFRTDAGGNLIPSVVVSNEQKHPLVVSPKLGLSYQVGKNDAVRLQFARSVLFPSLGFVDLTNPLGFYNKFSSVPSFDVNTGLPATFCGVLGNQNCSNYADQLRWENQNGIEGVPIQPLRPETFTNYEVSFSHQFPNNVSVKVTPFYRRGYDQAAAVAVPRVVNGVVQTDPNTGATVFGPSTFTNLGVSKTTGLELYLTRESAYGLSGSLSATYLNEFSNVIPTSNSEDFFPSIPSQSLALGNLYRVGFVSPFQATLAVSYKSHTGFRVNPIVSYNKGYPIGAGNVTSAFINNVPVNIPQTNANNYFGATSATTYVDPQNPGNAFNPVIAAKRGTAEGSSPGGVLSSARFNTNLSLEFNAPGSKSTFGVLFTNLFGNTYGLAALNTRYQPVATGVSGPKSGTSALGVTYPGIGLVTNYGPAEFGSDPYRIINNKAPQTVQLYYQLAL